MIFYVVCKFLDAEKKSLEGILVDSWAIDEQSAGQTVQNAALSAEGYETISSNAKTQKDDLLGDLSRSEFVHAAVEAWMENCGSLGIDAVQGMTGIALQGTSEAILAYHEGDTGMAANAQSTAATADFPSEMPKADGSANPAPPKEN